MSIQSYDDIIDLPHYEPKNHKRMSIEARSAQFAPFSALTGYETAIFETARLTDKKIELDNELKINLNNKLLLLLDNIKSSPIATFTYFIKDKNKDGGRYITITNNIKKIDISNSLVILSDKTIIPIDDIINITSEIFKLF